MALPNTKQTPDLNRDPDKDVDSGAYPVRRSRQSGSPVAAQASGPNALRQKLAARKEQETGVRQADAHKHDVAPPASGEAKFAKVNLIGSMMNEHAVFSLVTHQTQTDGITYLDLRGNGLSHEFGWRLIKAMAKQYTKLDFCNGIDTKKIRENDIDELNMTGFLSHNGLFGIEPVGAVFLAHFLRTNTSLQKIQFQRNGVGKDGSKAIAQAIIGNAGSQINEVNGMKPVKKRGVHFSKFQNKEVETIRMPNHNLNDEDIVFLEEYLSRYDCVKELDLKGNQFFGDGVRKLGRYIGSSTVLEILRLDNVPISLEGIQLLTKGVAANTSLTWIAFPIGVTYGASKELLHVMNQFSVALARHPKMERFGATPVRLDYVKNDTMGEYNTMRLLNTGLHCDVALFFWVMANCVPKSREDIEWNPSKGEGNEYPKVKPYNQGLMLAISSACYQMKHLTRVKVAICKDLTGVAQLLFYLAGSKNLKDVQLLAYGNAKITHEELPKEWNDEGDLPLWFKDCLQDVDYRRRWDALWGFIQRTSTLERFNNIDLKGFSGNSVEFQVLLIMECQYDFKAVKDSDDEITLYYGNSCDATLPFQATRLLHSTKKEYKINLEFIGKNQQAITKQQDKIAELIVAKGDGSEGRTFPTYTHKIRVRNSNTSKQLISTMEFSPCLEAIYVETIESVYPVLVKSLCVPKSREALKTIKINRYWYPSRKMPQQLTGKQLERLTMLHQWTKTSNHFTGVSSSILGEVSQSSIQGMSLDEFSHLMSGLRVEQTNIQPVYEPSVSLEIFHEYYNYFYPPEVDANDDENAGKPIYMLFPLHPNYPGRHLKTIHLTNANIKAEVQKMYADQYAESSKKLWHDKRAFRELAQPRPREIDGELPQEVDYQDYLRFHWNQIAIGSGYSTETLARVNLLEDKNRSRGFHFDVLYKILESIMTAPNLSDLDLRGNGFDADDVQIIIEKFKDINLDSMNGIPVQGVVQDHVRELNFMGGPIELPEDPDQKPEVDEYADPDYAATVSACRAWRGVNMDEGDGVIFEHLVTSKRFPNVKKILFGKHNFASDSMQPISDSVKLLPKMEEISFSECVMDNRAANFFMNALGEMSDRVKIVNNVGIGSNAQAGNGAPVWNDANLALIGRRNCWNELALSSDKTDELILESSISDTGLRGLSSYIRYAAAGKGHTVMPKLRRVDLSFNKHLTDGVIAEFARSLLMPGAAPHLEEIDLRYCPQLRARSAFELHHLVQRDGASSCQKLTTINGMNIKLLMLAAQEGKATAPLIVRMHGGHSEDNETKAPRILSEADCHFFAHCLHLFPNIPHCHLHMIIRAGEMVDQLSNYRIPGYKTSRGTTSPFVKPVKTVNHYDKQVEACENFFQACPVSTRLQFSMTPLPDIYYAKESRGITIPGSDLVLLPPVSGSKNAAKSDSIFGATVRSILKVKERRRKIAADAGLPDEDASRPRKPVYVNNINSQRLHNQYRALYGYDDIDIHESDIYNSANSKNRTIVPADVDLANLFATVSSLDIQNVGLSVHHMRTFSNSITHKDLDLGMLTHLNLNNNNLGDAGVKELMQGFFTAGTSLVHLTLANNGITDNGAETVGNTLYAMHRLTSLCLARNGIRETGAIHLASSIGGKSGEFIPLLSLDISENFCRELGAERWAKTLQRHPTLQFFNYSHNELAYTQNTYFLALIFAFLQSPALAVLDLSNNFLGLGGIPTDPPEDILDALAGDIPDNTFDPKEVKKGVFIRRGKK